MKTIITTSLLDGNYKKLQEIKQKRGLPVGVQIDLALEFFWRNENVE